MERKDKIKGSVAGDEDGESVSLRALMKHSGLLPDSAD